MGFIATAIQNLPSALKDSATLWKSRTERHPFSAVIGRDPDCSTSSAAPLAEHSRILATSQDSFLPEPGDAIDIGDKKCVVTSVFRSPIRDAWTIGLSRSFRFFSVVTAKRTDKTLSATIPAFVAQTSDIPMFPDSFAPDKAREWTVLIRRCDWPDSSPPQTGDSLSWKDAAQPPMKVKSVERDLGVYTLMCDSAEGGYR